MSTLHTIPVCIIWDIENCRVGSQTNVVGLMSNLRNTVSAAVSASGPLVPHFSDFWIIGDSSVVSTPVAANLNKSGASFLHLPSTAKESADKEILLRMHEFTLKHPPRPSSSLGQSGSSSFLPSNSMISPAGDVSHLPSPPPPPGCVVLISGDGDFCPTLHLLRKFGYLIQLFAPVSANPALLEVVDQHNYHDFDALLSQRKKSRFQRKNIKVTGEAQLSTPATPSVPTPSRSAKPIPTPPAPTPSLSAPPASDVRPAKPNDLPQLVRDTLAGLIYLSNMGADYSFDKLVVIVKKILESRKITQKKSINKIDRALIISSLDWIADHQLAIFSKSDSNDSIIVGDRTKLSPSARSEVRKIAKTLFVEPNGATASDPSNSASSTSSSSSNVDFLKLEKRLIQAVRELEKERLYPEPHVVLIWMRRQSNHISKPDFQKLIAFSVENGVVQLVDANSPSGPNKLIFINPEKGGNGQFEGIWLNEPDCYSQEQWTVFETFLMQHCQGLQGSFLELAIQIRSHVEQILKKTPDHTEANQMKSIPLGVLCNMQHLGLSRGYFVKLKKWKTFMIRFDSPVDTLNEDGNNPTDPKSESQETSSSSDEEIENLENQNQSQKADEDDSEEEEDEETKEEKHENQENDSQLTANVNDLTERGNFLISSTSNSLTFAASSSPSHSMAPTHSSSPPFNVSNSNVEFQQQPTQQGHHLLNHDIGQRQQVEPAFSGSQGLERKILRSETALINTSTPIEQDDEEEEVLFEGQLHF